jgi:hypothetical protein
MKKRMKYLRTFTIICVLGLLYSSCVKKANYPDIPQITFNSFTPFCSGSVTDSAYLRINFTDGNGDIGYSQQLGAPTDFYAIPLVYVYATKSFQPLILGGDTVKFPYSIPNITPMGNDKELNGIIQINFENFLQEYLANNAAAFSSAANLYNIEFQVWLYDRSGNKSNVIITPPRSICE